MTLKKFLLEALVIVVVFSITLWGSAWSASRSVKVKALKHYKLVWDDFSNNDIFADEIRASGSCSEVWTEGKMIFRICMPHMFVFAEPLAAPAQPSSTPEPQPGAAPTSSIAEAR